MLLDPDDPRTWPDELIARRNLALAWALGRRVDEAARAAFAGWRRPTAKPQPVGVSAADGYTTPGSTLPP